MAARNWEIRVRNAGIAAAARRHRFPTGAPVAFLCECDDAGCREYVSLPLQPYDRLRDDYRYIVASGHRIRAARLMTREAGFDTYRASA